MGEAVGAFESIGVLKNSLFNSERYSTYMAKPNEQDFSLSGQSWLHTMVACLLNAWTETFLNFFVHHHQFCGIKETRLRPNGQRCVAEVLIIQIRCCSAILASILKERMQFIKDLVTFFLHAKLYCFFWNFFRKTDFCRGPPVYLV